MGRPDDSIRTAMQFDRVRREAERALRETCALGVFPSLLTASRNPRQHGLCTQRLLSALADSGGTSQLAPQRTSRSLPLHYLADSYSTDAALAQRQRQTIDDLAGPRAIGIDHAKKRVVKQASRQLRLVVVWRSHCHVVENRRQRVLGAHDVLSEFDSSAAPVAGGFTRNLPCPGHVSLDAPCSTPTPVRRRRRNWGGGRSGAPCRAARQRLPCAPRRSAT
jgi:hypothetical protein